MIERKLQIDKELDSSVFLFGARQTGKSTKKRGTSEGVPLFRLKWSASHAAGGAQCRQECCECGYYNLHHYLNKTILLHTLLLTSAISHQPSAISLQPSLFTIHYSLFTRKEAPCGALFSP
jgi:hypothetical protein